MSTTEEKVVSMQEALQNATPQAGPGSDNPEPPKPPAPDPMDGHKNCPVKTVGVKGNVYFYLDAKSQFIPLQAKEHSKLNIQSLFLGQSRLTWAYWPRMTKPKKEGDPWEVTGWKAEEAAHDLMDSCAIKGLFEPAEGLRGRGCWRDDNGRLVMHTGDSVYTLFDRKAHRRTSNKPGLIDGYVYPGAPKGARPKMYKDGDAARELLGLLDKWYYARAIDPYLVFGWICAAILGGALQWRPNIWLTGDKATGKSTLQRVIEKTVGNIVSAGDATAASIWQNLGYQTLPVQLDEIEASEDNRKINKVVELARVAASGHLILRGGQDHTGVQFHARSCFLFSSILIPPLGSQDKSRLGIISLQTLPKGVPSPELDDGNLADIGSGLRDRFFAQWYRFDQTLDMYHRAMALQGHSNRTADVFGTLLACADLALHDDIPSQDKIDQLLEDLKPETMSELADISSEHEGCLGHLLSSPDDDHTSGRQLVMAELIKGASDFSNTDAKDYDKRLQRKGLRVYKHVDGIEYLLVANQHQGLLRIFAQTRWAGRAGDTGVWKQALERFSDEGAINFPRPMAFAGHRSRCIAIPMDIVLPEDTEADKAPGDLV